MHVSLGRIEGQARGVLVLCTLLTRDDYQKSKRYKYKIFENEYGNILGFEAYMK